MLFDLHVHSRYSNDALSKPKTIIKVCKKLGIGVSITDHNNMDAYFSKDSWRSIAKKEDVFVIPGQEINIHKDNSYSSGEVIGYFLNKPIQKIFFGEVLDEIKSQGALLSCPHPFDWPRKNFSSFPSEWKKFDCVETYNARAYYQGLNKKSKEFADWREIAQLGVSDAHTPEEIGNGLTQIDAHNEEEFRKQIKKRKTKVIINKKAKLFHHFQTQLAKRNFIKER
jgi:predicted metal-dependent phosphoesterase TrpH